MTITSSSPQFVSFMAACQKMITDHYSQGYSKTEIPILVAEEGTKFIKIVKKNEGVYCFVAKVDNTTKMLGNVVMGGVYKSASFNAPAKHARGNILSPDNGMGCMTVYGAEYLR